MLPSSLSDKGGNDARKIRLTLPNISEINEPCSIIFGLERKAGVHCTDYGVLLDILTDGPDYTIWIRIHRSLVLNQELSCVVSSICRVGSEKDPSDSGFSHYEASSRHMHVENKWPPALWIVRLPSSLAFV